MVDFDIIESRIVEIERIYRGLLENYTSPETQAITQGRKNSRYAPLMATCHPRPTRMTKSCVGFYPNFRDDLSAHEEIEITDQKNTLLRLGHDILDEFRKVPLLDHPNFYIQVRIYPSGDNGEVRSQLSIDTLEKEDEPRTLASLMEKLRKQIRQIAHITPQGPLTPWVVGNSQYVLHASTPAEAALKYAVFTNSPTAPRDFERDPLPTVTKEIAGDQYREDLMALLSQETLDA